MAKKTSTKAAAKPRAQKRNPHLLKAAEIGAKQVMFSHPWNPNSEIHGVRLSDELGMKHVGVAIARIPSGKESFVPHAHRREEEWLYILMGEGMALIGDKEVPVGMGDFLAFPAPQVVHHLRNVGAEDLVYLMGGEKRRLDVVDFPAHKKTMVWVDGVATAYDADAGVNPFAPPKPAKAAKAAKKKP